MRELAGIQTRADSYGNVRARGYVKERGRKVWGPWGTIADAKAWRARATLAKLEGGSIAPERGATIARESDRFLSGIRSGAILSRKNEPYAPKTVRGYEQAFRDWINPELGHIAVASLRRSQVQRWVDWLSLEREAGTVRNTWAALAALYAWLLPRHDDIVDPTDGVRRPRPGKPRERYADAEEMVALLDALPHNLALPYALAFYAGLRHAEMRALRWSDVEDEWIIVRRSLDPVEGFKAPKSGKSREVPVFTSLRPYLTGGEGLVLSSKRSRWGAQQLGTPYAGKCREHWSSAGLEPIGLHEARASFATALVRAGYDMKTVQEWMGHADPTTTLKHYVRSRGRQAGLTERMDNYLMGAR